MCLNEWGCFDMISAAIIVNKQLPRKRHHYFIYEKRSASADLYDASHKKRHSAGDSGLRKRRIDERAGSG